MKPRARRRGWRWWLGRIVLWGGGALVLLAAMVVGLLGVLGMPTYDVPSVKLDVTITPARVTEGKRLVSMTCYRCHFDPQTGRLSGRELSEVVTGLGQLRAPNITRDPEHGIGEWTTGELALLLRTGLHPKHAQLVPSAVMPWYPRMADDDMRAILAFLGSDDPWVEPYGGGPAPTEYSLVAKVRALVSWSPLPYPREPVAAPRRDELEAFGEYLVDDLLQCATCHSGDGRAPEGPPPHDSGEYLRGGVVTNDVNGLVLRSANLTPHATGLRDWTSENLRRALVDGFGPDDEVVRWPMPRYPAMSGHEVEAIHAYLQSVTPIDHEVEPSPPYKLVGRKADGGRHLYIRHGCHYCHGVSGHAFADLRGVAERYETDAQMVEVLDDPRREDPFHIMPPWKGIIAEDEYAELIAHVRELSKSAP